jgi:hypothetical protein
VSQFDAIVCTGKSKTAQPSAHRLSEMLKCPIKYPWETTDNETLFNWGSPVGTPYHPQTWNPAEGVAATINKKMCHHLLEQGSVPTLDWTIYQKEATEWFDAGKTVYCRTKTRASEGRGIVVANKEKEWPMKKAGLYTKFSKSDHEVRVLVGDLPSYDTILVKKRMGPDKLKANGLTKADFWVRTYKNGWVYCYTDKESVPWSEGVRHLAHTAIQSLGLNFAAVDVNLTLDKYSGKFKSALVLEVNSAPAIEHWATRKFFSQYA